MALKTRQDVDFMFDACNGCGVAQAMAAEYKELLRANGTDAANKHPIIKAYLLKLCDLAGIDIGMDEFSKHYNELQTLVKE
jgi:hypothetical protein